MSSNNRSIGLHVRIGESLQKTLDDALSLKISALQFFLFRHKENKYLRITPDDQKKITSYQRDCPEIYAHSSYWINLAHGKKESFKVAERLLLKELHIAEQLSLSGLVIHPGSYKGHPRGMNEATARQAALEQIAHLLNKVFKKNISVPIVLENTSHQKKTIGSNFKDFQDLVAMLDKPEKLFFCLDFAHAHAFGYNVTETKEFIQTIEKHINLDQIKLIHLHDSAEEQGSSHDQHDLIGTGKIGIKALKKLVLHPQLINKPIILELPKTSKEKTIEMLDLVQSWHD